MISKDQTELPLGEEGSYDECTNGVVLKKGPWTSAEDAILIEYVKKHGEGNWNSVQKHSGLLRCGKSCRLRWANHLRPNLKKGAFTQEEEQLIIELHAKMGNKWARMAAHGSQQCLDINGIDSGNKGQHDVLQTHNYGIPDVMFDNLRTNQSILPYVPELPDISASSVLMKGLCSSQHGSFIFRMVIKLLNTLGYPFPFDPDSVAKNPEIFGENQGSHTLANGNFSASKPTSEAVKLELPSLQYAETDLVESNSPRNSGLLDALLYEARTLSSAKNRSSDKSSNSSTITPGDDADCSVLNFSETEWEDYGDPISPLCHPVTSLFRECTPISASGSSLDESPPTETLTEYNMKSEPVDHTWTPDREKESYTHLNITRPDALLDSDWLEHDSGYGKDQVIMTEAIAALLGDDLSSEYKQMDLSSEYKQMDAGASTGHGWGPGSCSWNNMPAVCQMSEFP
ncbi:hypothetical protein OIU76_003500 [Salix suchowensis]|nr:hypothetical protein OIU76_003500 [Salix suchowensis]